MRLIDADALKDSIAKDTCPVNISYFYRKLKEAPVLDAVPVKYGKWIADYPSDPKGIEQGYRCSNCNTFFFMNKMFVKRARYCPNCGAKMDNEWRNEHGGTN